MKMISTKDKKPLVEMKTFIKNGSRFTKKRKQPVVKVTKLKKNWQK